ncbi:MAG: hypothetical protein WEE89_19470 [Gemmatimonadota bacterium]
MRVERGFGLGLLLITLVLSGCDRTPTDPSHDPSGALLLEPALRTSVYAPSSTSLSQLFRKAATKVMLDHGRDAQRRVLASWRGLNEQAEVALRTGDRHTAESRIAALRAEEITIVLRVLGDRVAERTARTVGASLAQARLRMSAAQGKGSNVGRARQQAERVDALLFQAEAAVRAGQSTRALDLATEASDALDAVVHFLISLDRIAGVETLFPEVVASLRRERGSAAAAALTGRLEQLNAETGLALRRGNRDRSRQYLELARREQIRIVLDGLGSSVVNLLTDQVDAATIATRKEIAARAEPLTTDRIGRMLNEAADLNGRARRAAGTGDVATALDLASHAAGLVNAAQHLLPR